MPVRLSSWLTAAALAEASSMAELATGERMPTWSGAGTPTTSVQPSCRIPEAPGTPPPRLPPSPPTACEQLRARSDLAPSVQHAIRVRAPGPASVSRFAHISGREARRPTDRIEVNLWHHGDDGESAGWSRSVPIGETRPGTGRGRSGLRRAGCWLTASRGDPQDSATESRPPMALRRTGKVETVR